MYASLNGDLTHLPDLINTPNALSAHPLTSPPINLISNIPQTLVAGNQQWEPDLAHFTHAKGWEILGWTPCSTLWTSHEVDGTVEVL